MKGPGITYSSMKKCAGRCRNATLKQISHVLSGKCGCFANANDAVVDASSYSSASANEPKFVPQDTQRELNSCVEGLEVGVVIYQMR